MSWIRDLLLPRQVDFNAAMMKQAQVARALVELLHRACVDGDHTALAAIDVQARKARDLEKHNLRELLDVFITPYDRESIYRLITQLEWVALSVRHCRLQLEHFGLGGEGRYEAIMGRIREMARTLEDGLAQLGGSSPRQLEREIDRIRALYDEVVSHCVQAAARLDAGQGCLDLLHQRDLLQQLKEIARRIHVAANTLEDMAIKVM